MKLLRAWLSRLVCQAMYRREMLWRCERWGKP